MRLPHFLTVLILISAVLLPFSATPALSQPQSIGLATHIENQVSGVIAGQPRPLAAGSNVYSLEVIQTNANSKAQFAFLDSTVLSVGPMSEVNLDRFVYDPNKNGGDVVIQMGRGTFRFITGSQEKRNYKIVTPVATIGVRGTIFHVQSDGMQSSFVLQEGGIVLTLANGQLLEINQPGWGITIGANGQISGPMPWPGAAGDPFGAGWQQFADAGNPDTTGAGDISIPGLVPNILSVNVVSPCLSPSCN